MSKDTENLDRFDQFINRTQAVRMAAEANLAVGEKNMKVLRFRQDVTGFGDAEWHHFYDVLRRAAKSSEELNIYFTLLDGE